MAAAELSAATISPDGRTALSGSTSWATGEFGHGELFYWDLETGELIRRFDNAKDVASIEFSADGQRALTCANEGREVTLWDVNTGQALRRFEYNFGSMDCLFGPDETSVLASTEGGLLMWDIESGELVRRFTGHDARVNHIDVSPNGSRVLSLDYDGEALRRLKGHEGGLGAIEFSRDGETAFSVASGDNDLVEWQISDRSLDEVIEWFHANRHLRDFTCEEREQYRIDPQCEQ